MPHTYAWNDGQTTVKKMLGLRGITRPQVQSIADSDDRIVHQWQVTEPDEHWTPMASSSVKGRCCGTICIRRAITRSVA
jgi:hypothetical protein